MAAGPPLPFNHSSGLRRSLQKRPEVLHCGFRLRQPVINRPLIPAGSPEDLQKWDPYNPSRPESAPSPSEAFFSVARRLSPIARFIADSFRRHGKWGPSVIADLEKLRRVTPPLVAEVLKAESDPIIATRFFHWAGRQKGYSHIFASYNAFTYCLNRSNHYRSADEVIELMNLQGKHPSEKQFEILIRMHSDANRGLRVFYIYQKMKKFGVAPRVFLYNKIMDALVRTRHLDLALSVYNDFLHGGLEEEAVTFMILAKGFCRVGRVDDLLDILCKMRNKLCKPDVFAYTSLIRVLVEEENLEGCLKVWDEMERDDVGPDVVAYSTLISALCKGNALDKAIEIFNQMKSKGVLVDRAVYGALVDGLVANGRVGLACDLLKEMTEGGYRADLSIYNSLIAGLCVAAKVDKAHKLLKFAVRDGLTPEFETIGPLLISYAIAGRMDDFVKLLNQISKLKLDVMDKVTRFFDLIFEKEGMDHIALAAFQFLKGKGLFNIAIINTLIKGLHKAGDIKMALSLYGDLTVSNICPDSSTYNNVIPCFVDNGEVREACLLYNKLQEMPSVPSISAYYSLVKGLCRIGEVNAAILLVRDCLGNVINGPMEFKYALTIIHACKSGIAEKVVKVVDEMVQQHVPVDEIAFCAIIYGICRHGTIDEARKIFSLMQKLNIVSEANVIVYDEFLLEHAKRTTAGLVVSGLKFFGLDFKLNKLKCHSKLAKLS